ncbi:venom carboxylesterase-6-like [Cylas formicarius]|uniref:venom carboxylesterase-6-like n=1 Tax=Cylas formicarius TaxID=197179 RepID=UPI0029589DC6|nr:venom carboxylesterase-6-like [Cylas formicarius]
MLLPILLCCAWAAAGQLTDSPPVVSVRQGRVRGSTATTQLKNVTYHAFRGIPFAQPPLGELRFRAPRRAASWSDTLNATRDRSECTQMDGVRVVGTEDCLYVNVFTPKINASLPVMVWIYGGGFNFGTSNFSVYNPDNFVEREVVFVSFNYRLGVFGFLSTGNLDSPGNWGLKDQVLALEWVRDNVARFGGNPNKVTIFGQSAGSASVSYLVQSPRAKGLFHAAIMESGTSLCAWALSTDPAYYAFQVGIALGVNTADSGKLVRELRKIDYVKLKLADFKVTESQLALNPQVGNGIPFAPVSEPYHQDAVFSGRSHELLKRGAFNRVPVIIGYTSNEAGYFVSTSIDSLRPLLFQYDADIAKLAPYDLTRDRIRRLLAASLIKSHFFGNGSVANATQQALSDYASDNLFNRPIRETANQMSKHTSVYLYLFSYVGSAVKNFTGVAHAEELRYLFRDGRNASRADRTASDRLVTLWTNFAKSRHPLADGDDNDGPLQNVRWPTAKRGLNRVDDDVNYLDIGDDLQTDRNPNQTDWTFYREIYRSFGDGVYTTY